MIAAPLIPWLIVILAIAIVRQMRKKALPLPLPPGPRRLPIIGNILDIPENNVGRRYADISSQYGDVVYLEVFGQSMILLGSYETARDLLEKRSAKYSSRLRSMMIEMAGFMFIFALKDGHDWRRARRAFHQTFDSDALSRYHSVHLKITQRFLLGILRSPKKLSEHLKFWFASSTMYIVYGIELTKHDDQYYEMAEKIMNAGEDMLVPGRYLVDVLPVLRHLPSWLPGMTFKRFAAATKREVDSVIDTLFDKALHTGGLDGGSMVATLMRDCRDVLNNQKEPVRERMLKHVAATAYVAGADTMNASLKAFFLAMAMYPDAQKKAQAELDAVVSVDRLLNFSDRDSLHYVNALVKELLRWHVIAPIGLPHYTTADDEYTGFHFPAGSVVAANLWAMAHDASKYPSPDTFAPERFLDANGQLDLASRDPSNFVFGFGRRICPGRIFADNAMFIFCATVLQVFDIGPPVGEDGVPIKIEHKMTTKVMISHPEVYEYTIKPRSSRAEDLILAMAA